MNEPGMAGEERALPTNDVDTGLRAAARAAATSIAACALASGGGLLAWFAYIDAPITDGAMALVVAGTVLLLVAAGLALLAREALLGHVREGDAAEAAHAPGAARSWRRATRLRRTALGLLLAGLLVLAAAALATLNLRGSGDDAVDQETRTTAASSASMSPGDWS